MKKIVLILIIGILVLNGLGAGALYVQKSSSKQSVIFDKYDMVIITPNKFSGNIQPLIDHKNSVGIQTFLKTTEEIYSEFNGIDKPEQIKYFIKDAIETWDISYVLLVGGLNSYIYARPRDHPNYGAEDWHLPVRYTNLVEPLSFQIYDPGFISDLYYADIYDSDGNFSTWDSNSDNIFAEWNMRKNSERDILDYYPDVAIGRLACRNSNEVETVVNKIISYETSSTIDNWFNRFIVSGGDPLNDLSTEYVEGEILGEHIIDNYMTEFESVRLYASYRDTNSDMVPNYENIIRELENGCGFFLLDAHGSPASTKTYWPGDFNRDNMINCLSVYNLPF